MGNLSTNLIVFETARSYNFVQVQITIISIYLDEMFDVTSMVITNPVIEGWAEGCNVVGVLDGVVEGAKVGDEVITTDCDLMSHLMSMEVSNASIEASTSSVFVVSTIRFTCALTPYSGSMITSTHKHLQ